MPKVFLGIGTNIDREKNLYSAIECLENRFRPLIRSSIYESGAVGFEGDPFLNLVVGFSSELPVQDIVEILRCIEIDHGRGRSTVKFSPRTLDIDLILYGDLVSETDDLRLPRDDILGYAFVLQPLAEIAPDLIHPVQKKNYAELWEQFDKTALQQRQFEMTLP